MSKESYSLWLAGGTALLVAQAALPQRQYALDSLLYAQLHSDKLNGSRFANYARWYSGYRTALEERGWVLTRSHSDYQESAVALPLNLLRDRLQARHPGLSGYLQAAVTQLSENPAQQCLSSFTEAKSGGVVYELGVLLPGPSIDLYGLAHDGLAKGIDLRESVVTLSDYVSEPDHRKLHAVLESSEHGKHIRQLGLLEQEASHGPT
ncbi:hypothetical protein [Pseudomonas faucium]|uniref:hypothetical protein n=1 Tax=Pseudomonas faucium TaxID=2740518 RepID=UPI0039C33DD9